MVTRSPKSPNLTSVFGLAGTAARFRMCGGRYAPVGFAAMFGSLRPPLDV